VILGADVDIYNLVKFSARTRTPASTSAPSFASAIA
jgi:hypothetical protein